MRNQTNSPADRFSRRRLLALAGGASAVAALGPASIDRCHVPVITPIDHRRDG